MTYNIEELEKAFGVGEEAQKGKQNEDEELVIEKAYIDKMHEQFANQLQKVGKELEILEQQTSSKRTEFLKVQGAYEVLTGIKRGVETLK